MSFIVKILAISLALTALVSCADEEISVPGREARPTKLITLQTAATPEQIRLPAIIEASDESLLTFQVPGLLQQLKLVEGDPVKKGDLLARLDQRDFANAVETAVVNYEQANIEHERAQRLLETNAVSQSVAQQRLTQLRTARVSLASARKTLSDSQLLAPFDGTIADVHVEQFEAVSQHQPIVTIQNSNSVDVVIQVPASLIINAETVTPTDVQLELDAAPGRFIEAVFKENVARADPGTQTYEARFSVVPPGDLLILPGMTGTLSGQIPLQESDVTPKIEVPIAAVLSISGKPYVWVVDTAQMIVSRRDVDVHIGNGIDLVVETGLEAGETIVGAGGQYLYEGAKITDYAE